MEITWLGAAGFIIHAGRGIFLMDPYLSRNSKATPVQPLKPSDIHQADAIFISHGHFDHLMDTAVIAQKTGARVFCSDTAATTLERSGLSQNQIEKITEDGWMKSFGEFKAEAFFSRHVRFDKKLLISTLLTINIEFFRLLPLIRFYPCGQVLAWRFSVQRQRILFFGSAGSSQDELERLAGSPVDVLLVPLQGHSDICDIAFHYVRTLRPRTVIPHHQDDFYPPISRSVDIRPFVQRVEKECPGTRVKVMELNETWPSSF